MRFQLTIDSDNEAMRTADDVARALRKVANRLAGESDGAMSIFDDNGNNVGEWSLRGSASNDECSECGSSTIVDNNAKGIDLTYLCADCGHQWSPNEG